MADIQGYYRIFGLRYGASIAEIKTAYRKLVRECHPDRFPQNSLQQKQAEEQIKNINIAYEALLDYQPQQNRSPKIDRTTPNISIDSHLPNAKTYYDRGVVEVEKDNLAEAIAYFTQAIKLDPEYLEAYQYRAFLREKMGFDRSAEADFQVVWKLRRQSLDRRYPNGATNISSRISVEQNRVKKRKKKNIWQKLGECVRKILRSFRSIFRS